MLGIVVALFSLFPFLIEIVVGPHLLPGYPGFYFVRPALLNPDFASVDPVFPDPVPGFVYLAAVVVRPCLIFLLLITFFLNFS